MCKKIGIAAIAVLAGLLVLNKTPLGNWAKFGLHRAKEAFNNAVPPEVEIAKLFQTASISYHDNPTALHLRAMNMLYEGLKEKGAMMIVPSTAVESMGMGGLMGMAAMAQRQLTDSPPPPETA